jgi:hypothetical protein
MGEAERTGDWQRVSRLRLRQRSAPSRHDTESRNDAELHGQQSLNEPRE